MSIPVRSPPDLVSFLFIPYPFHYSHEMPVDNELSKQNIQDRYHGRNDPVANKIMSSHASTMGLAPPEDQSIVCVIVRDEVSLRLTIHL